MRDGYIRVGAATPKVKVADCAYNADRIVEMSLKASKNSISVLVFPELSITGYTCQDMFLHKTLIDSAFDALMNIADSTSELDMAIVEACPSLRTTSSTIVRQFCAGARSWDLYPRASFPDMVSSMRPVISRLTKKWMSSIPLRRSLLASSFSSMRIILKSHLP